MSRLTFELRAEMEDGAVHDVVADQRDLAKWEVQPFGTSMEEMKSRLATAMRFLAWSALTRQGDIELKWVEFDARCIEVGDIPEAEASGAPDAVDPGKPARSATRSSASRKRPAKR